METKHFLFSFEDGTWKDLNGRMKYVFDSTPTRMKAINISGSNYRTCGEVYFSNMKIHTIPNNDKLGLDVVVELDSSVTFFNVMDELESLIKNINEVYEWEEKTCV